MSEWAGEPPATTGETLPAQTQGDAFPAPPSPSPDVRTSGATAEAPHAAAVATTILQQNIIVQHRKHGPSFFMRAVWYVFIGWWLTGLAITAAALFAVSVVLLPIAYFIVGRIPTLLTLRQRSIETDVAVGVDGAITITTGGASQRPIWQRALWFTFVGWWACIAAMYTAYALCLTIVLLPLGLMIFNRIPAVMTLQKN